MKHENEKEIKPLNFEILEILKSHKQSSLA